MGNLDKKCEKKFLEKSIERRTYVIYIPFLTMGGDENARVPANIFSCIDYSREEIMKRVATSEALDFILDLEEKTAVRGDANSFGLDIDLGYVVDARLRTQKGRIITLADVLSGVNSISIRYFDGVEYFHRSFLVNLEILLKTLGYFGFESNLDKLLISEEGLESQILTGDFDDSPPLRIGKWLHTKVPAYYKKGI